MLSAAAVRYNDWHALDVPTPEAFTPERRVSVVIPSYQTPADVLARTFAALERQTYPRGLFEVVIVDDGNEPPLARPKTPLAVTVVRQERRGFGLARARNTGVRAAAGEIILFLDSDLLAEAEWIGAHARWHHAVTHALTVGLVAHVDVGDLKAESVRTRPGSLKELLAGRPVEPPWVESHLRMTRDMTSRDDDLFRLVSGGNCGIRREYYEHIGGCDESFAGWGGEDVEFGYRAYTFGGLLIPAPDALAWHQGLLAPVWESKRHSGEAQHAKAAHLIAHPRFRHASPGRTFTVPQYVVTIRQVDGQGADQLFEAAVKILADRVHDLIVRLVLAKDDAGCAWLRQQLAPDPRVRIHTDAEDCSSLDEFPTASFHIGVSASVPFAVDLVHRLRAELGDAVMLQSTLPGGGSVSITRGWALHRELLTCEHVDEFGEVLSPPPTELGLTARRGRIVSGEAVRTGSWNQRTKASEWLHTAMHSMDSAAHARWFLKWFAHGCAKAFADKWRGLRAAARDRQRRGWLSLPRWFVAKVRHRTQVACWHFGSAIRGRRARAETPRAAIGSGAGAPAFDLCAYNPIGCRGDGGDAVAALGPLALLPHGVEAHSVIRRDALRRLLRRFHHLEDTAAFHAHIIPRARDLARLAACGVLVHLADGEPRLESLLGKRLFRLMTTNMRGLGADAREQLGIEMRRAALCDHSSWGRARQSRETLPLVSILLATKRPAFLRWALANVARQSYPAVELVLALHGDGFADVERCLAQVPQPAKVFSVPASEPLGAVLDAAAHAAGGTLLAKMDDDDVYGADHLWDLVLAREYSQAQLVGKWLEFVYLGAADRTIRWRNGGGERYQTSSPAGGTLLISRADLEGCGGWRKMSAGIDTQLTEDVLRAGGRVYRTHGTGFVLVRHGCQHTWDDREAADASLRAKADRVWRGYQPHRAGVEAPRLPHPALAPGAAAPRTASQR